MGCPKLGIGGNRAVSSRFRDLGAHHFCLSILLYQYSKHESLDRWSGDSRKLAQWVMI